MSFRRLLPLFVIVAALFATSASASDRLPRPVVSAGHNAVTLEMTGPFCWRDSAQPGQRPAVVCSATKAPDGRLKLGRSRIVHIDMGEAAAWVRLGRFRANRMDTSGRYWSVRVGRYQKQVHLLAGFGDQVDGSYRFGPVVLVP